MRTSRDAIAAKRDSRVEGHPEGSFYTLQTLIARDGGEQPGRAGGNGGTRSPLQRPHTATSPSRSLTTSAARERIGEDKSDNIGWPEGEQRPGERNGKSKVD